MASQKQSNIGICKPLRKVMNRKNLTVTNISQVLKLSRVQTYEYLKNPYNLRLGQLLSISGLLGIPYLELVVILDLNKPDLSKEDKANLSSLIARVSQENKEL